MVLHSHVEYWLKNNPAWENFIDECAYEFPYDTTHAKFDLHERLDEAAEELFLSDFTVMPDAMFRNTVIEVVVIKKFAIIKNDHLQLSLKGLWLYHRTFSEMNIK
jgi:hypothetical protein